MIKKNKINNVFLLCALFFVSNCFSFPKIVVDGADPFHPVFRKKEKGGAFRVSLGGAAIYNREDGNHERLIWHYGNRSGKGIKVKEIRFGETPPGLTEYVKAEKLVPDVNYQILIDSDRTLEFVFKIEKNGQAYKFVLLECFPFETEDCLADNH